MIRQVHAMLRRWMNQDVARAHAAQACVRLQRHHRQLEEADAYLARLPHREASRARPN